MEYNIIELIENIKDDNIEEFFMILRDSKKFEVLYKYFTEDEYIEELYKQVQNKDNKEIIVNKICSFYPLSKKIIEYFEDMGLRTETQKSEAHFLMNSDANMFFQILKKHIHELLKIFKSNTALNEFEKELNQIETVINENKELIDNYGRGIDEIKKRKNENKELIEIRNKLEEEIKKIEFDMKKENVDKDIEKLKKEIEEKGIEREKKIKEKQRLKDKLKELEDGISEKEEKEYIGKLIKLWPDDEAHG